MGSSAAEGMGGAALSRDGADAKSPPRNVGAQGRGRTFGSGPALIASLVALALVALAAGVLILRGGGPASALVRGGRATKALHTGSGQVARYGGLPSWLPQPKLAVGRLLHASPSHPALSIQGETVSVSLAGAPGSAAAAAARLGGHIDPLSPAGGHVLATAVGPEVPEEGRFPVPPVSPCTFILTFASASRPIPLSATQFTFVDEHSHIHHPTLTALGGGPPPREIVPGRPLSVKLHDILPTGDGGLDWTPQAGVRPLSGARPLVIWAYTVEID